MQVSVGFIKKMHFLTLDTRGTVHFQTSHIQLSTDILPAVLANSQKASSNEAFGAKLFRPFVFSCRAL